MFCTCSQEAIAQKLSDTRSLLGTARRLRATVADAEFAAWTARQRAGDVGPSIEERAVWREALAQVSSLGDAGVLQFFGVVSIHYGKPRYSTTPD